MSRNIKKYPVFSHIGEIRHYAGHFLYDRSLKCGQFFYDHTYAHRPDAIPLCPWSLPLDMMGYNPVYDNDGLYGVFRDMLPDFWGRLVLEKQLGISMEAMHADEYLPYADPWRSLSFVEKPVAPQSPSLSVLYEAVAKFQHDNQELLHCLRHGSSMGGARPKCVVEKDDQVWLAKFPAKDDQYNHAAAEFCAMRLAHMCGIDIPEMLLANDIFLTRRFDCNGMRHHYASGLTAMQLDERDRQHFSYARLAPFSDKEQLFRRMVFNIMCRNTDDHPRNHGFLFDRQNIALSPAFDITPSPSRQGIGSEYYMAMSVGPKGRLGCLDNAVAGCGNFDLEPETARNIVQEMLEICQCWQDLFFDHKLPVDKFQGLFGHRQLSINLKP